MIEVLLSLFILTIITINISSIFRVLKTATVVKETHADLYIAAKQISQELIVGHDIMVDDHLIYYDEKNKEITILLDNHRIVRKPGFEIFAFDIDELSFLDKDDFIYMIIERENQKYTFLIGTN